MRCVITPKFGFVRFCQYFYCFIYNAELWECLKSNLKLASCCLFLCQMFFFKWPDGIYGPLTESCGNLAWATLGSFPALYFLSMPPFVFTHNTDHHSRVVISSGASDNSCMYIPSVLLTFVLRSAEPWWILAWWLMCWKIWYNSMKCSLVLWETLTQ